MIPALLAAWIAAATGPSDGSLGQARALLAANDLAGAEQAARAAVSRAPTHGPSLMVLGLVQFRGEHYEEALGLFQRAAAGEPPPAEGPLAFNRGSAYYALGRYSEAEAAFMEAAGAQPGLTGLAEVNAGLAALGAGELDRARAHADAAQASDSAEALTTELADLRAKIAQTTTPPAPEPEPEREIQAAPAPPAVQARGLGAQPAGLAVRAGVGGGYDSNVSQLAPSRTEVIAAEIPDQDADPFLEANLDASYGLRLSSAFFLQLGYTFDQIGYQHEDLDQYALQVHGLAARSEVAAARWLRLGLAGGVEYQFTGLRRFEIFQRVATVEPQLAVDEGRIFTTLLRLRWQDKSPYQDADAYYQGHRLDLRVAERLRVDNLRLDLGFRHRREDIGTRTQDLGLLSITRRRTGVTRTFEGTYVAPYAYASNAVVLAASVELPAGLLLALEGGIERLRYTSDSVWYGTGTGPLQRVRELGRKRRDDDRLTGSAELTFAATDWLELGLRYDLTVNRSNIHFAFDDKNSTKHIVALEIAGEL